MLKCSLPAVTVVLLGSHIGFASSLAPIIVTAARTAQTMDDSLATVTVFTRDDIERRQAQSVQDLLRGVPGLNIANNGGPGKATSVFLRGTESDHVLVLIDGLKVGSATLGTTAFQHLPIEQIDRIEIVRGPRSSLYGSEAIGGVIQIFTRKGGGPPATFHSIGAGSDKTYSATTGISGGGEHGWFNLSANGVDAAGFNACNGKSIPDAAGCFTIEPDQDGHRSLSTSLRAGYRFRGGLEVDSHALYSRGDTAFDGDYVNESESVQQVLGGSLRYSSRESWQASLTAGRSRDESDNFKEGDFQSRFNTVRDSVSLQNDLSILPDHLLTLGVDYQNDQIDGTTAYTVTSRDNKGVFTQYLGTFTQHNLELSLRNDHNEQFGTRTTGGIAWGYTSGKEVRFTIAYGTAFKAPTFNELYYPDYGNPSLQPEKSHSVELGISGISTWGHWSLNGYSTQVDDLIAYDANTFAPTNIHQARIRGLETAWYSHIRKWEISANLTLLDPENRSNDDKILPRRAPRSLHVNAERPIGKYRLGATLNAEAHRYDDLANSVKLGGYTTIDLRWEYAMAQRWKLQARIDNLLDKNYETAAYFNQSGRSLFVTLRYQS